MDSGFIDDLASGAPTPGGGAASAYCGAIAASLSSMVANLTIGKAKFKDIETEVLGCLARLSVLSSSLLELAEEDARAFEPLAAAYKMPRETDKQIFARDRAIQDSLMDACVPPMKMMESLTDVLHECDFLARRGSRMAISDAGASALIAKAAMISASLNVYINANSIDDAELASSLRLKADDLLRRGTHMADEIYAYVASQIDAYRM